MRVRIYKPLMLLLSVCALLACAFAARAETAAKAPAGAKTKAEKKAARTKAEREARKEQETERRARRLRFFATYSTVFESNVNHDEENLRSFGFVPGLRVNFRDDPEKPALELDYQVAFHRYTNTDRWNRVSQKLSGSYERKLTRQLYAQTSGEISLKGSSEDRELSNQYVVGQELEYRLTRNHRLAAFAAYRLKRYEDDEGRNAVNPYFGGRYEARITGGRVLQLSYRYDPNRTWNPRNRYIRWTYGADFRTPVFNRRNQLSFEARYKQQLYARTVRVDDDRVPRRDRRWILGAAWDRQVNSDLQMGFNYRFETRNSNDPDKKFNAHMAGITFSYNWWK